MAVPQDASQGRARGLSVWLVPEASTRLALARTIAALSRTLDAPIFPPHVTLVGGIDRGATEVVPALERLAQTLQPVTLHSEGIGTREIYFRALFLQLRADAALVAAQAATASAVGRAPDPEFFPHLSLAYGWHSEPAKRAAADPLDDLPSELVGTRIEVYRTEGPPSEWSLEAGFDLSAA
jgi:2'-5' RNA ligase